jgi:hypothetical protein
MSPHTAKTALASGYGQISVSNSKGSSDSSDTASTLAQKYQRTCWVLFRNMRNNWTYLYDHTTHTIAGGSMRILTDDEVATLTGHKTTTKQSQWLEQNGIRHWVNAKNKVRITDTAIEAAQQGATQTSNVPNFAALQRTGS